ncbi:hypothetical protein FQA39_LY15948 [Lamprigera yunnana]|nr:hypothetical protein FQA39_LY15948 [Lamprigera yunnana]
MSEEKKVIAGAITYPIQNVERCEEATSLIDQPAQPTNLKGLLKFAMEATKAEDAPHEPRVGPLDDERKCFLDNALNSMNVDIIEVLRNKIKVLQNADMLTESSDVSQHVLALETILDHVDHIDTANDFHKIGGFSIFIPCLKCVRHEIRLGCCDVLAELCQNNPYCQKAVSDSELVPVLLKILATDANNMVCTKALYAISCIIRQHTAGFNQFIQHEGLVVLLKTLQRNNEKLITKTAFLLSSLCSSQPDLISRLVFLEYIPMLIKLLETERMPSHEHVLSLLLLLVSENSSALNECKNPKYNLREILNRQMNAIANKEECQLKMASTLPQQFCVRWNSYQSNLQNAFPKLLTSEHFVDVTLACENEMLKCHKVVLSACSTYFEKLLLENPCQHPIIFMKDMKFQEMQLLVDFMYKGEVNVTQDDLPSLLKSAEALQIRGLCGSDQLLNQHHLGNLKAQMKAAAASINGEKVNQTTPIKTEPQIPNCTKEKIEETADTPQTSSETDSNEVALKEEDTKDEGTEDDIYYEGDGELMDTEFLEEEALLNSDSKSDFAIANVSCQYDGSSGGPNRRIRRSDEELRRAAECITRGQTFQNVSDQFNIPISTIRFYMARKGILPRRKRGRSCSGPSGIPMPVTTTYNAPGNTSPIGPPYHIVHYKLPPLGVSKLK